MTQPTALDRDMIPNRIANALPLPIIDELHAEAKAIKAAETQLQMRRLVLVTRLRENGMSWDSCGWFFGATGEAVRKLYGALVGDPAGSGDTGQVRGRPEHG